MKPWFSVKNKSILATAQIQKKKASKRSLSEAERCNEEMDKRHIHRNKFLVFSKPAATTTYWTVETPLEEEVFKNYVSTMQQTYPYRLCRCEYHKIQKFRRDEDPLTVVSTTGVFACPESVDPEIFHEFFGSECEYYKLNFK